MWHLLSNSACSFLVCPFFLYPAFLLIPWYCDCLWRTGNETPFFPSPLPLPPFITQKPWIPAMTVSYSPNELILHEGRIILSRQSRLSSLSLFSIARFSCLLSSYTCCKDTLRGPWSVVFSLQVRRWENRNDPQQSLRNLWALLFVYYKSLVKNLILKAS